MKKILVDSCIWIAGFYKRDKYHQIGKTFLNWLEIQEKEKIRIVIIDLVLSEIISFILKKTNFNKANEVLKKITTSNKIELIFNSKEVHQQAVKIFKVYKELSLVDSTIIVVYKNLNCDYLISTDHHFNLCGDITTFLKPQ